MRVAAGGALPKQGGMTFVQKMRSESAPPTQNNVPGNKNVIVRNHKESTGNNRFFNPEPTSNRFLNPSSAPAAASGPQYGSSIPMHMKKKEPLAVRTSGNARMLSSRKGAGESSNRLLNGSVKQPAPQKTTTKPKQRGVVGAGDWLQTGGTSSNKRQPPSSLAQLAAKKKQRSVNTVGAGGWDGSVLVPKPCRLFQGKVPTKLLAQSSSSASSVAAQQEAAAERILQQQSEVALQRRKEQAMPVNPYDSRKGKGKPVSRAQQFDDFFSNNAKLNVDTEKVLNAKSRFASEADAENYAKSRRAVTELEKQEDCKEKKGKKMGKGAEKRLTSEWICTTCGGARTIYKPMSCIAARHKVKLDRDVVGSVSKTEQRTKLHDQDAADGGLRLGAGLDWSGPKWSRFSS
jgi:rubrerythrin